MKNQWKKFSFAIALCAIFVAIIGVIGGRLNDVKLLADQGASWYLWKLPEKEVIPRLTAWGGYLAHQIIIWILIYRAQFKDKKKMKKYINLMIIINILFIALHIVQTHLWYDGLAQDMPILTSQGSVIIMLVLVLAMEVQKRGLFFGKKIKKLPIIGDISSPVDFIKKYHGYVFSWAIIYTFWFHPAISTSGHLVGFFYLFLLFVQMCFMYTPIHRNKYWTFALEVMVLFHGTMVAINQGNNMWPMFMFGFASLVVITQLYGLELKKWIRRSIQIVYIVGVIIVFGGFTGHREIYEIHQVLWIPIIEYLLVFVFIYSIGLVQKINRKK